MAAIIATLAIPLTIPTRDASNTSRQEDLTRKR